MNEEKLFKDFERGVVSYELTYRKEKVYLPIYTIKAKGICLPPNYERDAHNLMDLLKLVKQDEHDECQNDV